LSQIDNVIQFHKVTTIWKSILVVGLWTRIIIVMVSSK
jgi:hypothetical protein